MAEPDDKEWRRMFVKVCGLTTEEQIDWAIELGYSAIGVMTTPKSKRYRTPEQARALAGYARGRITTFAVALEASEVAEVADAFDVVQLYQWTDLPNLAFCSSKPPGPGQISEYFFYDASAGSGVFEEFPDWVRAQPGRVVLAGGLDPDNVAEVIDRHRPYGVDVSSSVETAPGVKSYDLMRRFKAATERPEVLE
ncbi:phosphoribosylanthranilate isomerase [Nocardia fluminea]|uniref:phosphoribosylanthranilate isomerase n=1 Tax=Nocardia fluminea TaxID=134984 RepID=UPI00366965C8